ncbi:hypothetical protein [Demequina salsinemoris]|uniref:hypothetical protein n=1 Tax=Demequina salsinemoris TaxID=577470 RepID=UPI00078284C1|nr:hypothetical protein [Demequina salsinemoris]
MTAADAIGFFTPEGERRWVPGWDPQYPAGEPSEEPGTVFVTHHGGAETVWTVVAIDHARCRASYVRHRLDEWAGTVSVRCEELSGDDGDDGECRVTVAYDTTLLPGGDPGYLAQFRSDAYEEMMSEWAAGVTAAAR